MLAAVSINVDRILGFPGLPERGLLAGSGDGLYGVFAGIVGALLGAVMNAWLLLVEILR